MNYHKMLQIWWSEHWCYGYTDTVFAHLYTYCIAYSVVVMRTCLWAVVYWITLFFAYCRHRNALCGKQLNTSINFASFFISCYSHELLSNLSTVRFDSCNYCHTTLIGILLRDISRVSLHLVSSTNDFSWRPIFTDANYVPHTVLLVESINTTSMEDVSTRVLDKIMNI